jgi:DNA-binding CsgD family transcriptional regulator/tetratricopeptide (TPR) repeat protein
VADLLAPVVIGRAKELDTLWTSLESAAAGRGSAVLVTGEPGVGKTRLLREVRRWCAERNAAVLVGRAVDTATPLAFRPVAEALMMADRVGGIPENAEVAPFRPALARLVPSWVEDQAEVQEPASLLHIAEGFLRVVRARGRTAGVAVVLLDDLQWADAESLDVIEYVTDNLPDEPVLLVMTARSQQESGPVRRLNAMVERRSAVLVRLSRLTAEESTEMTKACLGEDPVPAEVVGLIRDHADGLPFLIEELLAGLTNDGALVRLRDQWVIQGPVRGRVPSTVVDSVRRRFESLPAGAQRVLIDAALFGRRIDVELLGNSTGLGREELEKALRGAAELTLLHEDELGMRFRHALTRDALLAELPSAERSERSALALAALRAARPELPDDLAEVAADLAESAGDRTAAAELLAEVGRRATRQGALTTAESAQRRALTLVDNDELELELRQSLVTALGLAGRVDEAFQEGERLLVRLAEPGTDPDGSRRRTVHLALARAAVAASDWPSASAHLDSAAHGDPDPAWDTRIDALRAVVALGEYRLDDADRLAGRAVAAAARTGDVDLRCEALLAHGRCLRVRDLDASARAFAEASSIAGAAGVAHWQARALTELGFVDAFRSGDPWVLDEAKRLAVTCGAPETEAVLENALAAAAWYRGDVDAELAHATTAVRLARRYRLGQLVPAGLIMQAASYALRGEREAMDQVLAEAEPLIGGQPNETIAVRAHCRGACALARAELDVAAAELAIAGDLARSLRLTALPPLVGLDPLMRAVNGADPTELISEFRMHHHHALPQLSAMLVAAEAVRLGRGGDAAGATSAIERALAVLAPNGFVSAVVAWLVGTAAAAGAWGDAASWLLRALEGFEQRGLVAPAAACRAELRRLGRPTQRGDDELTAREHEVLELVAQGLANRVIAKRLFLSPRTVEKHVERLLTKTGAANRAQLAVHSVRGR